MVTKQGYSFLCPITDRPLVFSHRLGLFKRPGSVIVNRDWAVKNTFDQASIRDCRLYIIVR